jgi:two-component system, NtrC family, nitrogen regulation sensor histidine kinase NtrY
MKFRFRITLLLIIAAIVPLLALFISMTIYANRQRESLVNMKLNAVYGGAVSSYERLGKSVLAQMEQLSTDPTLVRYLLVKDATGFIDQQGLIDYLTDMKRLLNLDYLTVTSPDGKVLARGHDPGLFGDDLSADPVFSEALKGQKVQSLDKINDRGEAALTTMGLIPIWYENRELIGVLAGGISLNEDFCRQLRDLSGAEILLIEGDLLLAKTISGDNNEMSLYLQDQQTFHTKLQGLSYTFSRYPLQDYSGNKVADLLMGVPTQDLDVLFNKMRVIYGGFALGGLILAIIFGFFSTYGFTKPIESLTWAADQLASGDFSTRVKIGGKGELANLVNTFNDMAEDLEDYKRKLVESERLAAFTTMARKVAHEIKNPLTPIKIAIEDLSRAYDASDPNFPEAFKQSTKTVLEEVASLTKIVDEFSSFAKFPQPSLAPDDLNEIVRSTVPLFTPAVQKGLLSVVLSQKPIPVMVDRDQIKRAIMNLIKNALEAIPPAGMVKIQTVLSEKSAIVVVSDNGPGISESAHQNLFTPYFTTKSEGSGLGLVIVKRIVSDHDGRVKISAQTTGGTSATIELPLYRGNSK